MASILRQTSIVSAATYTPPSGAPPTGNIPQVIFNRLAASARQTTSAIDIDGGETSYTGKSTGISVGSTTLDLGSTADPTFKGQNVYYGIAAYANMFDGDATHPADSLMKLQTYDAGVYTDRLTVNKDGDIKVTGCFGATYEGLTTDTFKGDAAAGYVGANNKCVLKYPTLVGVHVCTIDEMLESIKCGQVGDPIRTQTTGDTAWINGGAPGYPSLANDCNGWTSLTGAFKVYGRIWTFNTSTGGSGALTECNSLTALKYACCK